MDWPPSLMPQGGKGTDAQKEYEKTRIIVDQMLAEVPVGLKSQEIEFLCNMIYDEYMGSFSELGSVENRMAKPMMGIQILEAERYSPRSRERELMQLFASSRVAERIPGMTWEKFIQLTPAETDMVFEITRQMGQATDKIHNDLNKDMEALQREAARLAASGGKG